MNKHPDNQIDFRRQEARFHRPSVMRLSRTILLFSAASVILSACVSGPGSYFETIGANKQGSAIEAENSAVADLSPGLVESEPLEPVGAGQSDPLQTEPQTDETATQIEAGTPTIVTASALGQSNVDPAIEQPAANDAPMQLGMVQNGNGEILIAPSGSPSPTPTPAATTETDLDSTPLQPLPGSESAIAYASPQTEQTLSNEGGTLMARTDPSAFPTSEVDENGFAIGTQSDPVIHPEELAAEQRIPVLYSQINHGQCKSGFGPKPKKISATKIVPGDPYYIEIRMRKTPLLPVGHTYVAYGRLGPDGNLLDEKLIMLAPVGGYAGAALASGIPMPGVLTPHRDDCRIRPETAYRVSLNARRYEKLLLEIQKAKQQRPSYLLFANNCNHFMTRIAQSVGLKPPKNIYVPALEYIYAMIENNEGRKISRR